jgi:hypothetical protein
MVRTPTGYKAIETIQEGDIVISHCGLHKKVLKAGKWLCNYATRTLEQTIYKIVKGSYGATSDVYISHFHKISNGTHMLYPNTLGLKEADPAEYTKHGAFTLYHLQIEKGRLNHLVVNGNCWVDSWIL